MLSCGVWQNLRTYSLFSFSYKLDFLFLFFCEHVSLNIWPSSPYSSKQSPSCEMRIIDGNYFFAWIGALVFAKSPILFTFLQLFIFVSWGLTYATKICLQLEKSATLFRPKLIVAGASAYARLYDYARIRKVSFGLRFAIMAMIMH